MRNVILLCSSLMVAGVAAAAPSPSSITIGATSSSGVIRHPYLAIVRDDQPWRRPLREEVLEKSNSVVWNVPPGRYRAVAGAQGFATNYGQPIEIRAGQSRSVVLDLERLVPLGGLIVDEQGQGVSGARVGLIQSFAIDAPLRLSELGESALAGNTLTTADHDGRFTLPAHPRFGHLLYIEAAGYEPRLMSGVKVADGTDLGAIGLKRGGALTVTWSGERSDERGDRLVLVPKAASLSGGLTREMAMSVWTREVRGTTARWVALPPGVYELWLNGWRRDHNDPPVVVASLTIATSEKSAMVTLPQTTLSPATDNVQLRLLIEGFASPKPPNVEQWLAGHAERVMFRSVKATGGTVVEIEGGCRAGAVFVVDTGKSFGVTDPVLTTACGDPLPVKLMPVATLKTEFIPPSGSRVPSSGTIRLADCRRTSVRRLPDIPFAITAGAARIRLPSGCSVPIFTAGDLTAATTPIKTAEEATVTLPAIRLERGSTILARVVSPDQVPLDGIVVSAISSELKNTLRPTDSLDALPSLASGVTQNGGWVKLTGIIPDRGLVLMLRDPKRRVPVFTDAYRPKPLQPLLLDPLELMSPASLMVHVQIPRDLTDHGVSVLAVEADAAEGNRWPKFQSLHALIANGTATFDDIPPGKWRIRALGRLEGSTLSALGAISAEVTPGSHLTIDLPIDSNLYHGVVTLRGEPVRGDLTLRHERGATAQARLTDDGRFAVILAQTGVYQASLRQRPGDGDLPYVSVPRVDITSNEHDVVIAIPEGRISGRVIDANGNGVAGASITATGTQIGESVKGVEGGAHSTADGTFVLDGLSDGTWAIEARQEKRSATPVELVLSAGQQLDGVKLILSEAAKLTGQITTADGAPADGVLVILDRLGDAGFAGPLFARTGADGQFSIDISESLQGQLVDLKVRASDSSVASERITAADPLLVQLPATGSVRLSIGKDSGAALMTVFVADDGSNLNVSFCHPQVTESGDSKTLTIPHLAAGHWRYVEARTPADVARIIRGEAAVLPAMATFSVQPGLTAEVNLRGEGGSR